MGTHVSRRSHQALYLRGCNSVHAQRPVQAHVSSLPSEQQSQASGATSDLPVAEHAVVVDPGVQHQGAVRGPTPRRRESHDLAVVRRELRERVISLKTMEPMVRVAVIVAIALLLAGLILGSLKDVPLPEAKLAIGGANPIVIALPVLVLVLLSFCLAWGYAIVGALYSPVPVRVAALGCFALAMLDQGSAFWTSPASGRGALMIVVLALLSVAVGAHGCSRRGKGWRPLGSRGERLLVGVVFVLVGSRRRPRGGRLTEPHYRVCLPST